MKKFEKEYSINILQIYIHNSVKKYKSFKKIENEGYVGCEIL